MKTLAKEIGIGNLILAVLLVLLCVCIFIVAVGVMS